jgi:adenylosuccinate lyase
MSAREQLLAVTPLDGRDRKSVEELSGIVSEYGLMKYRVAVEAGWLSTLNSGILPDVPALESRAYERLDEVATAFSIEDAERVKEIEKTTNHDVKAIELWLREKLADLPGWEDRIELAHFGLTSEDLNNLAYAMMLREARDDVFLPGIEVLADDFLAKARQFADIPMLAHTHGQPASPTTVGKEMAVTADRLYDSHQALASLSIKGKLNGATGNYNALDFAYPEVDWPAISRQFIEGLDFEVTRATTQIEPHDWMVRIYNELALANSITANAARDMWLYIALKYFKVRPKEGETGSSTMPHKVNPINFEKSWSNFDSANVVLAGLAARLPRSLMQRDLSDSSTQRTVSEAFGHTLVGQKEMLKGLGKVDPNEAALSRDLDENWAVLTEAVQTVMRRYGVEGAYDIIKAASRGRDIVQDDYLELVDMIEGIPDDAKQRLAELTPETYIGLAPEIARGEA